jgi:catechol 2,3-dioxygenase-like lactoylglutathione lyase family enzyme
VTGRRTHWCTAVMRSALIGAALAVCVMPCAIPAHAQASPSVSAVRVVGMTVSDMDRSVTFFTSLLTFRVVSDVEVTGEAFEHATGVFGARARIVRLRLADEDIELTQYLAPRGRPIADDARSNDRDFQHVAIIVRDLDAAYALLRRANVEHASTGPQRLPDWNVNAGGIKAFYFKDPDHHVLELLEFPPTKGAPKWHRAVGDTLFLGIDHTAIVSGSTDASLAFYRDVLGLRVAGSSENYGTEQEHLNNVFGARLRITALRAAAGPGIELLEYLAPTDGRRYPDDARSNDLLHWETTLTVNDAARTAAALQRARTPFVSPGVVVFSDRAPGFARTIVVRDPDGHVLRLVEP